MIAPVNNKASLWGALLFVLLEIGTAAVVAGQSVVTRVVDGDTVWLDDGRQVRLIGINTPELGHGDRPDQALSRNARNALQALIGDKPVRLVYGPERHDRHGRTLAYLELSDGSRAGEKLLQKGLAFMIAIPPNVGHVSSYRKIEFKARAQKRGVWNHREYRVLEAGQLSHDVTGFHIVRGQITNAGQTKKNIYLDIGKNFTIVIARKKWHYFGGEPKRYLGQRIHVRGWINRWGGKQRIHIGHPAMLEILI